jgi:hypothetical protein
MSRVIFLCISLVIALGACTQRLICPAYQSSFIHDKAALKKKFSYFTEDANPKLFTASTSKNRYLVAVPESYRRKLRSLQTVEMKPVYPEIPDSLKVNEDATTNLSERDAPDSTSEVSAQGLHPGDSAYAITKAKEKYNVDQDNYMWYFRDLLVLPDVRAILNEKKSMATEKLAKQKGHFFKNLKDLFKKKPKDSTQVNTSVVESEDEESTDSRKKKDSSKKKKNPPTKKPKENKKQPEKKVEEKKEDEDDGF